jgi:ABC-2 type transport system permease protein
MGKELQGYFNSPLAYIIITVFLVLTSWLFFREFFLTGQSSMRSYIALLPWVFLFLIPAITMRLWAEEQKMGTLETLFTAPITPWEAVLGKFMASLAFLVIMLMLSITIPLILLFTGNPDLGAIIGGYLGALLLGASYLAIGIWVSSVTDSQIIAFILSAVLMFMLYIIGEASILQTVSPSLVPALKYFGLGAHFSSMARGVLDSRDLIYYTLVIFTFLYLNVTSLRIKKWK